MSSKGKLILYTGASGVGKGTIMKRLLKKDPGLRLSVSATTREPRPGEVDGREYFFVTKDKFKKMIEDGGFLEYAEYCGNFYGTPQKAVEEMLSQGLNVILEIEVQGGVQVMKKCPDCTSIFIMPPSMETLESRLRGRNTEPEDVIAERLETAKNEVTYAKMYQHTVVNDDLDKAVEEVLDIIHSK